LQAAASTLRKQPPLAKPPPISQPAPMSQLPSDGVSRRDLLGGLLHEYELAA